MQISDGTGRIRDDVDFVQIRNRDVSARELCVLVRRAMASVTGARILVNDRIDVALACGAAGVHLRDGALAPGHARRLGVGIVSVACHDAEGVRRAEAEGADFAVLAPVFSPRSKADTREPLGTDELRRIARHAGIRIIALGGITHENAPECIAAGAAGIAGITLFR